MRIVCIDIGNTRTHLGVWDGEAIVATTAVPTPKAVGTRGDASTGAVSDFVRALTELSADSPIERASFCTVVPSLMDPLREALGQIGLLEEVFQLTAASCPIPIHYPRPEEIGQDRLAAAVAAHFAGRIPAVVMDVGTAVTFDVVTTKGYEGGIIAPGMELMSRYLHEQTALLPELDFSELHLEGPIGKSTVEAMKLGCVWGFRGMMREIQESLVQTLEQREQTAVTLYATGGSIPFLPRTWKSRVIVRPHLIFEGLAEAATHPHPV